MAKREAKGRPARPAKARIGPILEALAAAIPEPRCSLAHRSPYELLIATVLAAQCTDEKVNQVTPVLFARWPTPEALARASQAALEEVLHPTGFFRQKALAVKGIAGALVERHGGRFPEDLEALTALRGVGRKTANLVLGTACGREAIFVDTHVSRVAERLGLTKETDPDRIEEDLARLLPAKGRTAATWRLLLHGRHCCKAKKPECPRCPVQALCPSAPAFLSGS